MPADAVSWLKSAEVVGVVSASSAFTTLVDIKGR